MAVLAFDIGGTHFRYGQIERGRLLPGGGKAATPKGTPADLVREMGRVTAQYPGVKAIGVSFCGAADANGVVLKAPNIWGPSVSRVPLARMLHDEINLPVAVVNDMTAAAYREYFQGIGRDFGSFFLVTVSSGVGSKLWRGNDIVQGEDGVTGELGHFVIDPWSKIQCGCGGFGHLESLASGIAAERIAQTLIESDPLLSRYYSRLFSESVLSAMTDHDPARINNQMLAEALKRDDQYAQEVLRRVTMPLAIGLNHVWAFSKPEKIVVIGGFALNMGEPYFASLRQSLLKTGLFGVEELTDNFLKNLIIRGTDDDHSGVIGAGLAADQLI